MAFPGICQFLNVQPESRRKLFPGGALERRSMQISAPFCKPRGEGEHMIAPCDIAMWPYFYCSGGGGGAVRSILDGYARTSSRRGDPILKGDFT